MKRRLLFLGAALAALLALPGAAQTPAGADARAGAEADLYLLAMQAIAEGRRSEASQILVRMIAQGPRQAGEWLDLAMLQCALGHAEEAEQLFRTLETSFAPPPGVRELIAQQRERGCAGWKRLVQWSLSATRGHDRNVNQGASNALFQIGDGPPLELTPDYLPKADAFSAVSADLYSDLNQDGTLGMLQVQARRNDTLSSYNTISLFGGVDHPWRLGRWRLRNHVALGAFSLGGRLYQLQSQAQLRATPPLALPAGMELNLAAGLAHTNYRTLSNFDSNTAEVRAILNQRSSTRFAQLSLSGLYDRATANRPGGDRKGWYASVFGRQLLRPGLEAELEWTLQHWQGQSAYSPGFIDATRHQLTHTLRSTLVYNLNSETALVLDWRKVRNQENIPIFQYDNQVVQLSWRWRGSK
ncbi:tetratricopeptide repeat protein [Massilia sp. erpn]|uniref:tetratricopeptide repeat protein n=1 Tax=Massilia sp. erpn TaxID=2738142 RepID=UPI0021032AEE|nr:tetratricopeptide repeat protein [Massilia sp. erpn]UTY58025.1 tetratricopeptide repeat protein [Massilia sp. erpn]